jgi:RNA polymerase sigma-70 factor, ECF subfamily
VAVRDDVGEQDPTDLPSMLHPRPRFETLFIDEYPKMVALAAAVSGSRLQAEDLAQEAMSRLDRDWDRVQGLDKPGGWLRRVTINLALSHRRRLVAEAKARLRLGATPSTLPPSAAEHEPVWQAVAALPGKQRAAIALRYLEDRSVDEIAGILDIAPATARVHLHRGRQALRERLGDFDPTPPTHDDPSEETAR